MRPFFDPTAYRYPHEQLILGLTLTLVFLVIAFTATATLCSSALFVIFIVTLSYATSRAQHQALVARAQPVTSQTTPGFANLVREIVSRLQARSVQVFITPSNILNAYTFGLSEPKVIVLYSSLFQVMDEDELRFIVGHELGHVRLGHTWLNSLVGGMAGIPSPSAAAVILHLAFRWWNRACEFSADRAGLLVCGKPDKAISALLKLAAGGRVQSPAEFERALRHIQTEDDDPLSACAEALATHPMMVRRIEELRRYAASAEYRRLQAAINSQ